ncbi:uncharacterized protein LOC143480544 [Brachyhypopomus gauderio]|uniref:uncharacterized protein LOC143480544 n=1 Tax=Brachyhypopomus gauderio TaxID=698409 RepID=UPI0040419AAD
MAKNNSPVKEDHGGSKPGSSNSSSVSKTGPGLSLSSSASQPVRPTAIPEAPNRPKLNFLIGQGKTVRPSQSQPSPCSSSAAASHLCPLPSSSSTPQSTRPQTACAGERWRMRSGSVLKTEQPHLSSTLKERGRSRQRHYRERENQNRERYRHRHRHRPNRDHHTDKDRSASRERIPGERERDRHRDGHTHHR